MTGFWIAVATFLLLNGTALISMRLYALVPQAHREEGTRATIRLVANIFVVVASLVFGLMINSSRTTFDAIDQNNHAFATDLILMDRMLRHYGPEANETRAALTAYVQAALEHPARANDALQGANRNQAEARLDAVGDAIARITPKDSYRELSLNDLREHYHRIVTERWSLVERSEGAIPVPLLAILVAWLVLIFASYGYGAPDNNAVKIVFLSSTLLLAVSLYFVMDMDIPFSGPIQISDAPLRRALALMQS